ncbi:Polysaccharide deacetylase [Thermomonospora echinospora]|uniref:Polysaccharide deacetylase n=1 Tax=Thermomonospora echinospora TaxID=1992 RepID=A0A1H6C9I6_9ACTN|nr:polysaccharide deacetylase family protein [Thermomonospora echinospora]SEG69568.1 Polysaccharide deacetylase [Thermomonospora echinospora]
MKRRPAGMPLILRYRSVGRTERGPARPNVPPEVFERQMDWLYRNGLQGVSVGELRAAWRAGRARGLVGLTFDGGYADFATRAAPVLLRRGFTATVFVAAAEIGGESTWDTGPRRRLMSEDQIHRVVGKGMELGSHGLRYVSLPGTDDEELVEELTRGRSMLEDLTGGPVTGFAYPYGHVLRREMDAVRKAGYEYACAVWRSLLNGDHALPRTRMGDHDRGVRMWAKVFRHQLVWRTRV